MLSKISSQKGFSLFELVVVISILGILLLFTVPAFRNFLGVNDITATTGRITSLVRELKTKSVIDQKDYLLKYDSHRRVLYVWTESMNETDEEKAVQKGLKIEDNIIFDFESGKETEKNNSSAGFYKDGYSDSALIKMNGNNKNITIKIRPFLIKPDVIVI